MTDALLRLTAAFAGRYTIERELGAGGMATVYLAEDLKHQRKVAVKVGVVSLWQEADPELQPLVDRARRRLDELRSSQGLPGQ